MKDIESFAWYLKSQLDILPSSLSDNIAYEFVRIWVDFVFEQEEIEFDIESLISSLEAIRDYHPDAIDCAIEEVKDYYS